MDEFNDSEYVYRWAQRFDGGVNLGRFVRLAVTEVKMPRQVTQARIVAALEELRTLGLVRLSGGAEAAPIAELVDRSDIAIELVYRPDSDIEALLRPPR